MHPAAYDHLPYTRVAVYVLWSRWRIQLWLWPAEWRRRILDAALNADPDMLAVAAAVCREAKKLVKESP